MTLNAVGTPLSGNVNFSGTATDNAGGAGIASWKVQYSPAGTNTWTDLCTDAATPFGACPGNVDGFADGLYDFRALATDSSGNTRASTVQTNRRVDTDGPVASITSPANNARVSGTITMVAAATDPAGVQWVRFDVLIAGNWVAICTDNTATYTCAGDTTQVADGTYQIRVVARDNLGHESTSASTTLTVDNAHPTATNVQTLNGGTQGRIDSGDTMTFTWSEPMAPASIMTGWAGGSQAIRVFVDNNVSGVNNDAILIYNPTTQHAPQRDRRQRTAPERQLRQQRRVAQRHDDDVGQQRHGHRRLVDLRHDQHRRHHVHRAQLVLVDRRDRCRGQHRHRQHRQRVRHRRPRLLAPPRRVGHAACRSGTVASMTVASTEWVVGIALGVVVIAVAAAILITIVALAARISKQAATAEEAVEVVRAQTDELGGVARINDSGVRILHSARALRKVAVGK